MEHRGYLDRLRRPGAVLPVCDPCCGSGGVCRWDGRVGYEIKFNRYCYEYTLRPLEEIEMEVWQLELEIVELIGAVTR